MQRKIWDWEVHAKYSIFDALIPCNQIRLIGDPYFEIERGQFLIVVTKLTPPILNLKMSYHSFLTEIVKALAGLLIKSVLISSSVKPCCLNAGIKCVSI